MFLKKQVNRFGRWLSHGKRKELRTILRKRTRSAVLETMEPRLLMTADPIWVGGVYIEEDVGSDQHGDRFVITFRGGAPGTQLNRLIIDGDLNTPGFGLGDLFFDTLESGLGADHAYGFQIEQLKTANPNATVRATVADGTTRLTLDFTNFQAGDVLIFSIDVDEAQSYDPNQRDLEILNSGFDPITSGVEFQGSLLRAEFSALHYENSSGQSTFLNRYDPVLAPTSLELPADDEGGKRDRSAGTAVQLQQVPKPISIAGVVYVDNNLDLRLQAGEQRLSGVRLELFRKDGTSYAFTGHTTLTDSQGRYTFGTALGLQPGTYQVRESQPSGYFSVGATSGLLDGAPTVGQTVSGNPDWLTEISIPLGDQHATDLNFAEAKPASISGYVYLDNDNDGVRDPNEAGLPGVEVRLVAASSIVPQATLVAITDANGFYQFTNLAPGVYSVAEVIQPAGYLDGKDTAGRVQSQPRGTAGNDAITAIRLDGNDSGTEYNFGELAPGSIAGRVIVDTNGNCILDAVGDRPLEGVTVELLDSRGVVLRTTRTNAEGRYQFDGLAPGEYAVREIQPSGLFHGDQRAGSGGGDDSQSDLIRAIGLGAGVALVNYDFCEIPPAELSGYVFVDRDSDCVFDPGELPLGGVVITLVDANGGVVEQTTTDAAGRYQFTNLRPGTYSVREQQPVGYLHGGQKAGSGGGNDLQTDVVSAIAIMAGQTLTDYNFCEIQPSELSGYVFVDEDSDCFFDPGEQPISGVAITLVDQNGVIVAQTVTEANGQYRFTNLRPGSYTVRELQPIGFMQGGQKAGSGGGNDSVQDVISAIAIGSGQNLVNYNFCEISPASLAGQVYVDRDFDCIRDDDEDPLSGVLIELLDSNGRVIATTLTDANGQYRFDNLPPGIYSVRESQPAGYFHGGQIAPTGNGDDSVDDLIAAIMLSSGARVEHADFCEVPPATISGYVFQDGPVISSADGKVPEQLSDIRDGLRTPDDTPISSVRVQLRTVNGQPLEASRALPGIYSGDFVELLTGADGYYQFTGLRPGAYHIYQTQPVGYSDALDTPGTTGGFSINRGMTEASPLFEILILSLGADELTNPGFDAILLVSVDAGVHSLENNFSEVITQPLAPPPPNTPPLEPPRITVQPQIFPTQAPLVGTPLTWAPLPPLIGYGYATPPTWHLSVINAGFPRGRRSGEPLRDADVARSSELLNVHAWTVRGLKSSTWRIVSTAPRYSQSLSRIMFDVPGAKPLAGDFNGDGFDELALFVDGEWFIDLNGNGRWDEADIWLKLGSRGDQPVVGDWDGDGKSDVGIFGKEWLGDDRALAAETGLPDPDNLRRFKPKNVPPTPEQAPDEPRLMQRSNQGPARADLVDHVFRLGSAKDIAIAGDFNGDGIASVGVFNGGKWTLDVDGDGQLIDDRDRQVKFGEAGDQPLVGDFDGNGIDELAIVRGNRVIVDSNGNGRIDATDQVFMLEDEEGTVVVGDFDGDGKEEPALHQSSSQRRTLEARR